MGLVVISVVVALGIGLALGGEVRRLAAVRLVGWPLLLVALVVQLIGGLGGGSVRTAALVGATLLAVVVLGRNRRLPGVLLVAAGLLLNAAVIAANGAMPVSAYAAARAGTSLDRLTDRHEVADAATRLAPLSDVVPVALPLRPEVASPGDVLVAAGLALFVVAGLRRAPGRRR